MRGSRLESYFKKQKSQWEEKDFVGFYSLGVGLDKEEEVIKRRIKERKAEEFYQEPNSVAIEMVMGTATTSLLS